MNFRGSELQNHRAHTYSTIAAMNADVASAAGRVVYNIEGGRHYFGKPGAWVGLGTASSFGETVANLAALPGTASDGDARIVLDDGSGVPNIYMYDLGGTAWRRIADHRILLRDGTVAITAILSVTDANTVLPTAPAHLVTKKYSDDELAAHAASGSAHASAITTNVNAVISTHDANAGAHSAAINAGIAAHDAAGAAHSATITSNVNGAIATHDASGAAHSATITTAVNGGIATHDASVAAHATAISTRIANHDANPYTHTLGDDAVPQSRSGATAVGNKLIIANAHGSPLSFNALGYFTGALRKEFPVGLAWRPSSSFTTASGSTTFDNSDSNIVGRPTAGVLPGYLVRFPSSASNTGYFKVATVVSGTELTVTPAPVDEVAVTTTMVVYRADGIAVFGGEFKIDNAETIYDDRPIQSIIANAGDGDGRIVFTSLIDGKRIRKGDSVIVSGTVANNGTYPIRRYDFDAGAIVVEGPMPANAGAAGSADITHAAQAHNFDTSMPAGDKPIAFYADVDETEGYNETPGVFKIGHQIDVNNFVVNIQRVNAYERATVTAASVTLDAELHQYVPTDSTANAITVNLPAGADSMEIEVSDVAGTAAANNVTLDANGSDLINGAGTNVINTNYGSRTLKWRAGQWRVL